MSPTTIQDDEITTEFRQVAAASQDDGDGGTDGNGGGDGDGNGGGDGDGNGDGDTGIYPINESAGA